MVRSRPGPPKFKHMIHFATASPSGTSFHGITIKATPNELVDILGKPDYINGDKTNMEWVRELDSADVFTIYDWKNYSGIGDNQMVSWHIGARNKVITENAEKELSILLVEYRNKVEVKSL